MEKKKLSWKFTNHETEGDLIEIITKERSIGFVAIRSQSDYVLWFDMFKVNGVELSKTQEIFIFKALKEYIEKQIEDLENETEQ